MRKLLFLLPVAASALFLTGCNEVAYRERTVIHDRGPGYYGDDFYYASSRPYSRTYGQLYLRGGRYYYSRGGTYVVYNRPVSYRQDRYRHVERDHRDRHDWNDHRERREDYRERVQDRREDYRERLQDRREDRRDRIEDRRDRNVDRLRVQQRTTQSFRQPQFQQTRLDVRGPRVEQRRQVEVNRQGHSNRGEHTGRKERGDQRRNRDRDERD